MRKSLSLKREALAELSSTELVSVAGGYALTHLTCTVTDRCGHGPSFDAQCPTLPINECKIYIQANTLDCPRV